MSEKSAGYASCKDASIPLNYTYSRLQGDIELRSRCQFYAAIRGR